MQRAALQYLLAWLEDSNRKPLVVRGARQVGKTYLVRELARVTGRQLIEINFEKSPFLAKSFRTNNIEEIITDLEATINETIRQNDCILFLDEIQAAPEILAKLRWFKEDAVHIAVIAAGSLLEFVLEKHEFSMPVGRITYLHLEPLSFMEFLQALGEKKLYEYLEKYNWQEVSDLIHLKLTKLYNYYLYVGGMPEAVADWLNNNSLESITKIHNDLLATYRDDFAKYAGRLDIARLDEVMNAIPISLGSKFVYQAVNQNIQVRSIRFALEALLKARICHKVILSNGSGVPIGATLNEKFFKVIFLDVGLASTQLGLKLTTFNNINELSLVNKGAISEQIVGQSLRTIGEFYQEPNLYYWARISKNSNAELDYIVQFGDKIIPIEVKSGSTGSLKSLHLFMAEKKLKLALRINSDKPSVVKVKHKLHNGKIVNYNLASIPFYLINQLPRLLEAI